MKPIEFPQQTIVWAKNQPSYLPLPAYTDARETIGCWGLTFVERARECAAFRASVAATNELRRQAAAASAVRRFAVPSD